MQRLLILLICLIYSCSGVAKPGYQIDVIIFAQQTGAPTNAEADTLLLPPSKNAIVLQTVTGKALKPYALLPHSYSDLKDQYYSLSRRSHYPVLGYYSWRQPANNQSAVAMPLTEYKGWQMQGTFRIKQSNYYTFDADLQVSPPNAPQSAFTVTQKQRLKNNVVYYLDHDQVGMVVKIHALS